MKIKVSNILVLFIGMLWLYGCSPTRNIPDGSYLLQKTDYKITKGKIKQHNIPAYIAQKPNKSIFFIKFYALAYDFGTRFRDSSWINRQLTQNIGEKPVIYDSMKVTESGRNIKKHLNNLGFYNSSIYVKIKTKKLLKTAKVTYIIEAEEPYTIRNIKYNIPENDILRFVQADLGNSTLKSGDRFTVESLKKERERIVNSLNNIGYYYFITNQITFLADTNLNNNQVDITLNINPLKSKTQSKDSVVYIRDKQFIVKDIYIIYNLQMNELKDKEVDTTNITINGSHKRKYIYHFIHKGEMDMSQKAIINGLFMKPGLYYKKNDFVETYKALTTYNTFRYINIEVTDVSSEDEKLGKLICHINLLKSKKFAITSNSEIKNTGGDFGLEQNLGFKSRNTFKNAEVFDISLHGAMEMQTVTNVPSTSKWPFNVYEAGLNASLNIPRFLSPFKSSNSTRYFRPKTKITMGYNFQKRPDYTRYITNGSFGYTWQPIDKRFYNFKLFELSSVKIYPTSEFQKIIDGYTDPRVKYSYQDHLVLSTGLSYNYNEHRFKGLRPFSYLYSRVEVGGFPWNIPSQLSKNGRDSLGRAIVFGLPSSEYILLENDARYYVPSGKDIMHVFRSYLGIGIPYGATKALPFEKSFYIGGANSLRAWSLGTLGPGSFNSNSTTFEVTGDIKIEFNYEFRFTLSGNFQGAVFTDIGNVWLLNKSETLPGGNFTFPGFIEQFAADFGYGLRYDLEFLIIRVDLAHPLYQPYLAKGSRWTATNTAGKIITGFNFAIGYPF